MRVSDRPLHWRAQEQQAELPAGVLPEQAADRQEARPDMQQAAVPAQVDMLQVGTAQAAARAPADTLRVEVQV